uniref:Ferritin n=1 Tax=Syphacia muris TaxID=451379 RepID=A0A0N5ACM1_9BILA
MPNEQSLTRHHYSPEAEAAVNRQINMELYSSYLYLSMATYFSRSEVSLPHISKWLKAQSDQEREHALMLIQFQTLRGGKVKFEEIKRPEKCEWESALEAFEMALKVERDTNNALLELHGIGETQRDPHLCAFIEEKYLREQVLSIDEIGRFVAILKRAGKGLGEYIFDTKNFQPSEEAVVNETITELSH